MNNIYIYTIRGHIGNYNYRISSLSSLKEKRPNNAPEQRVPGCKENFEKVKDMVSK